MIYIAKYKALTCFIQYNGQFEIQISDISVNLKKVSMLVFNSIYTRGDQKVRGKVLLNRIAFIDCNENL